MRIGDRSVGNVYADENPKLGAFRIPLEGYAPVRFIYLDEAGTSAKEPRTIVAGVVVHADTQWRLVESELNKLIGLHVPEKYRPNFIVHAKEIYGGTLRKEKIDPSVWSFSDRIAFLEKCLALPRKLGIPICMGVVRRDFDNRPAEIKDHFRKAEWDHIMALQICTSIADNWLRDKTPPSEVATMVCEDLEKTKKFQKLAVSQLQRDPYMLNVAGVGVYQAATKIIDCPHFAAKDEAPLLQLADLCAFTFRRFFIQKKHGDQLIKAMLGEKLNIEEWEGPASSSLWDWT